MPQLADVLTYLSCLQGKMKVLTSLVTDLCKDRVCAEEVENLAKRFHVQDAEQCRLTFLLYANVLKIIVHNQFSPSNEARREMEYWANKISRYRCLRCFLWLVLEKF